MTTPSPFSSSASTMVPVVFAVHGLLDERRIAVRDARHHPCRGGREGERDTHVDDAPAVLVDLDADASPTAAGDRPAIRVERVTDGERLWRADHRFAGLAQRLDDRRRLLRRELALGHEAQHRVQLVTHQRRTYPVRRSTDAWPPRRRSRRARATAGSPAARPVTAWEEPARPGARAPAGERAQRSRRRGRWIATSPDIELKMISGPPAPTVTRRRSWWPSIRWSRSLTDVGRDAAHLEDGAADQRDAQVAADRVDPVLLAHGQLSLDLDITGHRVGAQAADDRGHHAEVAGDRVGIDRNGLVGAHGHVTRDAVHARRPAQPGQGQVP